MAVAFRVVQHIVEVIPRLFVVWVEENPRVIYPRQCMDFDNSLLPCLLKWLLWAKEAVEIWCFALLVYTFEPIPAFCTEVERLTLSRDVASTP